MKYYKLDGEVFAFEDDGSQDDLITEDFIRMSIEEVDKHCSPEKYLTEEDIAILKRQQLPKLSKRQFSLYLYDNDLYDQVMNAINADPRFKIEFDTVADIDRLSPTVLAMTELLSWTDNQVDEMWFYAINI